MVAMAARYGPDVSPRIYELVNALVAGQQLTGASRAVVRPRLSRRSARHPVVADKPAPTNTASR